MSAGVWFLRLCLSEQEAIAPVGEEHETKN